MDFEETDMVQDEWKLTIWEWAIVFIFALILFPIAIVRRLQDD